MSKQTYLIGTAEIRKAIASITNRGKKLDADIQYAGLSVLNHIELHGDVTLANELFKGMPQGSRKNALAEWFLAYGKLEVNTGESKKDAPFLYSKDKVTKLDEAAATEWYKFKPEAPVDEVFDFQAMLQALLSKAEKAEKGGKKIEGADVMKRVAEVLKADPLALSA